MTSGYIRTSTGEKMVVVMKSHGEVLTVITDIVSFEYIEERHAYEVVDKYDEYSYLVDTFDIETKGESELTDYEIEVIKDYEADMTEYGYEVIWY